MPASSPSSTATPPPSDDPNAGSASSSLTPSVLPSRSLAPTTTITASRTASATSTLTWTQSGTATNLISPSPTLSPFSCAVYGFEDGELGLFTPSNWLAAAVTDATSLAPHNATRFEIHPHGGSYMAQLMAGGGPNVYTQISVALKAAAGATLSFVVFFDSGDYPQYNDDAFVVLEDPETNMTTTLFATSVTDWPAFGESGWLPLAAKYTFESDATVVLRFGVRNRGDNRLDSALYVDDVEVCGAQVLPGIDTTLSPRTFSDLPRPSPSGNYTNAATGSSSLSSTPTCSSSGSGISTQSETSTSSATSTSSSSSTASASSSLTVTSSMTASAPVSGSTTTTSSRSGTASNTVTRTRTGTGTATRSLSVTSSRSATATRTQTLTATRSMTRSRSPTPSVTASLNWVSSLEALVLVRLGDSTTNTYNTVPGQALPVYFDFIDRTGATWLTTPVQQTTTGGTGSPCTLSYGNITSASTNYWLETEGLPSIATTTRDRVFLPCHTSPVGSAYADITADTKTIAILKSDGSADTSIEFSGYSGYRGTTNGLRQAASLDGRNGFYLIGITASSFGLRYLPLSTNTSTTRIHGATWYTDPSPRYQPASRDVRGILLRSNQLLITSSYSAEPNLDVTAYPAW